MTPSNLVRELCPASRFKLTVWKIGGLSRSWVNRSFTAVSKVERLTLVLALCAGIAIILALLVLFGIGVIGNV
jgi:cell division inhibitor SulA